ncbi:NAD-dependent epimerase/dehydratase family protein [Roseomonas sp. WA12]
MTTKVFVAGASGVIGRSLVPCLRDAGYTVTGTSRSPEGKAKLVAMGINAVVVDVFDAGALEEAVWAASPDVLIHQLTDLSGDVGPAVLEERTRGNARLRREGTANLVAAAMATGVKRVIAQSIGWAYAPKDPCFVETDPLDVQATGLRGVTVSEGVIPLESAILDRDAFEGVILRYGQLYGPGTWSTEPCGGAPLHVEAAAFAALLAVDHGRPGAYNIAEPGGALAVDKALSELGWRPDFRISQQA